MSENDAPAAHPAQATKRGRPSTGRAKTAAERKRAQRSRQIDAAYNDLENAPISAILGEIGPAISKGQVKIVKRWCAEMIRRAEQNNVAATPENRTQVIPSK